jgi:hypothetical protein
VASLLTAKPATVVTVNRLHERDRLGRAINSPDSVSDSHLQVLITPIGTKWRALLDGNVICIAGAPLVWSARILIGNGLDPDRIIEMWHVGAGSWSLRGRLGVVAATLMDGEAGACRAKNGVPVRLIGPVGSRRLPFATMPCAGSTQRLPDNKTRCATPAMLTGVGHVD